ncbi:MAG: leucyl/phenylalanyl-tRNA--protein transferase [Bacteroidales bacterium]|jgi:leucyl/phenylalanyl-tRNA--protein transferase|nr:leucyl/phenylalanyl-tRNA--protein transferase [Bacteroidales bacterium]
MILLPKNRPGFPDVSGASDCGLLALGGDLSPEWLILAYRSGIFPLYEQGEVIHWWAPNPRFVLFPDSLRISHSTKKLLDRGVFTFSENRNFKGVITNCAQIKRTGQTGSWITGEMLTAYCKLHDLGLAKSVEVWQNEQLVGGFYGVDLGHIFCGESMFSRVSNASKCGFTQFVMNNAARYKVIDCQLHTNYLEQLGGVHIPREEFMKLLNC